MVNFIAIQNNNGINVPYYKIFFSYLHLVKLFD